MHHLACEAPGERPPKAARVPRGGEPDALAHPDPRGRAGRGRARTTCRRGPTGRSGAGRGWCRRPPRRRRRPAWWGRCCAGATRGGRGRASSRMRRSPSPARTGRSPSRRARSAGSWRSRRPGRASSLRTGWRRHRIRARFRILATTHSLGRDEPGTRPQAYTNFLDATRPGFPGARGIPRKGACCVRTRTCSRRSAFGWGDAPSKRQRNGRDSRCRQALSRALCAQDRLLASSPDLRPACRQQRPCSTANPSIARMNARGLNAWMTWLAGILT